MPLFYWPAEGQPYVWVSDDDAGVRFHCSRATIERIAATDPTAPPAIYLGPGRLKRRRSDLWDAWSRQQRETYAAASVSAAPMPEVETPPIRRPRGRPPGSKNKKRTVSAATSAVLEAE
jgi:hypothetical protein